MRRRGGSAEERLERLLALQSVLAKVSRDLGPAVELEPVLKTVLGAMRELVEFRGGSICLVDGGGVYIAAADPAVSDEVAAARVPVGSGLAGRCVAEGETVYSPDLDVDPRVDPGLRRTGSNAEMRSYLAVPLVCLGHVIGLLQVDSVEVDAFSDDDLQVLHGLAAQVAGAIESARRFEQMQRLDDARSMFIARVSHELRTPLTILRGFTSTLAASPQEYGVTALAQTLLQRIDHAGARLETLVDELVRVTSFETGLGTPDLVRIDLAELLDDVRSGSRDPERVSVQCGPGLIARADPALFVQALNLLVQNGLDYGGDIDLTGARDGSVARIDVIDHGPGIADDRKVTVFERFTRGEHGLPGWGLGLPVARHLVEAMGGELVLSDTPGGGATFAVRLAAVVEE